jgi:hypothetical protein
VGATAPAPAEFRRRASSRSPTSRGLATDGAARCVVVRRSTGPYLSAVRKGHVHQPRVRRRHRDRLTYRLSDARAANDRCDSPGGSNVCASAAAPDDYMAPTAASAVGRLFVFLTSRSGRGQKSHCCLCWDHCLDSSRAAMRSLATRNTCFTSSNRVSGRLLKSMSRCGKLNRRSARITISVCRSRVAS